MHHADQKSVLGGNVSKNRVQFLAWVVTFQRTGSNSSPRLADLTDDGVLDVVLGAGYNEGDSTRQGVIALDGKNGRLLWEVPSSNQIVGSATFLDVSGDGVPDVAIGGRGIGPGSLKRYHPGLISGRHGASECQNRRKQYYPVSHF